VLGCVREALLADGVDLTECRLLDIYLWAYSGQYDPLWRRAASTPTSQAPHAPDAATAAREAKVSDDIEVFRDAEAEYLAWIARHQDGS
jgi:hypothetical protein